MFKINTLLKYSVSLILSNTKRNFESLGKQIGKSGDTIKRWLPSIQSNQQASIMIAQFLFKNAKVLTLAIDDTLLQKRYSRFMSGASYFFDTKLGQSIMAYRLIVGVITNGKYIVPIDFGYIFDKNTLLPEDTSKTKLDFVKQFYNLTKQLFPDVEIKLAADGIFATINILDWCLKNGIQVVMRMHRNRIVIFKNQRYRVSDIQSIKPRGRQMARTIKVVWNGLELYLTAERRIDKNGIESIVYLVATYKVKPIQYVHDYKKRWTIEKFFRTSKQHLGLSECSSRQLIVQEKHVAAVLLAYGLAQLEIKKQRIKTPEEAIRSIKAQDLHFNVQRFSRLDQIFRDIAM